MRSTKKIIKDLFESIGVKIEKTDDGKYVTLVIKLADEMRRPSADYVYPRYVPDYNKNRWCTIDRFEHFMNILRTNKWILGVDKSDKLYFIKNPYLGCNSLEEMLIKKDLLFTHEIDS